MFRRLRTRPASTIQFLLLPLALACTQSESNRESAERWLEARNSPAPTTQPSESSPNRSAARNPDAEPAVIAPHAVRSDALIVNDEIITVDDILEPILPQVEELAKVLSGEMYYRRVLEFVRQQIVDAVAQHLIYRRASRTITEEMEPAIKRVVEQMERERIGREFHGRETEYENYLQRKRRTRDQVKLRLRKMIVVDSYLRDRLAGLIQAPRKQELESYYEEHKSEFAAPGYRELYMIDVPIAGFYDRDILLMRRPPLPEEEIAAEKKAREAIEAALAALNAGDTFEDVAKKYSNGPHKENGGYWGKIQSPMAGRWRVPYEHFLTLKSGETSGIIEASKAFFIVKVGEIQEENFARFEDVQPDIVQAIKNERFQKLKAEFLQRELDNSILGSLDQFVGQVMAAVPKPHDEDPTAMSSQRSGGRR